MRAFLAAYPPVSLSPPITDLIITTCDFQKDLLDWNISPVNDGFDAKSLFNMYITKRINDKHLELLESCKLYKVEGSFQKLFPRLYAQENNKEWSEVLFSNVDDRWAWDLNGGGDFCVKDARDLVDEEDTSIFSFPVSVL
ncbi:hypothetical protein Tco_0857862 [Tanacetum coccineum]|uniref:Uncharacterized protein n=1 Tax=Tanacetum coccineum TaxID=301880 RepID=A0ABQ5B7L7_9ASTR